MLRRHGIPPKAAPYDPVTSSSSALISAAKKRLAIAERKVVGKGKKRGPKPGPRTPKAVSISLISYDELSSDVCLIPTCSYLIWNCYYIIAAMLIM